MWAMGQGLRAQGRALSRVRSGAPDVPQVRGEEVHLGRPDPHDVVHRDREGELKERIEALRGGGLHRSSPSSSCPGRRKRSRTGAASRRRSREARHLLQLPGPSRPRRALRQGLSRGAGARGRGDLLGYHSIRASDDHGEPDGYCPSPVVACAALAVAAPNCRIGQGVALAPLYGHPMRMAEDLSVVDNLSGGRIEIGLGQGYRPPEFDMFGWNYKRRTTRVRRNRSTSSGRRGPARRSTTRARSTA